jgi:hypothetical protein
MERKLEIYERAEKNDDGDYILDKKTYDQNVSKMFRPGKRKTNSVEQLLIEARLADEKPDKDRNPAFPINGDVADEALDRIEAAGLEPAWLHGPWEGNSHD